MSTIAAPHPGFLARRHRSYYLFVVPALILIGLCATAYMMLGS